MPVGAPCGGVVKRWTEEKGFGFIMPDDGGQDVFVHRSALVSAESLATGDKVWFQRVADSYTAGRFRALDVVVTGAAGCVFADLRDANGVGMENGQNGGGAVCMELLFEIAGEAAADDLLELVRDFTFLSSWKTPFLVISDREFIEGIRAPAPEECERLLALVAAYTAGCEARRAALLVDLEGELPGHGGEITIAQLQWTSAIDVDTLTPRGAGGHRLFRGPGLFIDMQSPPCVAAVQRIMESPDITKLLWGCQGDCESLVYQVQPVCLQIEPAAVIDAQLAFDAKHLIGLSRMLEYVSEELLDGLPKKEQINWDAYHARNCRALTMPLDPRSALYAVDDLHRIEAVICSKQPPTKSYASAREATTRMLAELRRDPCGVKAMHHEFLRFEKKSGVKKTAKAVQLARHVRSIYLREAKLSESEWAVVRHVEDCAAAELRRHGVEVPRDLSFGSMAEDCRPESFQ